MNISHKTIILLLTLIMALATSAAALDYPPLYDGLPKYANAELIDSGRQQSSLRDGLVLKLVSGDPLQTIVDFYKRELSKQGWTVPPQRFFSQDLYMGEFAKGKLSFQLQVTRTRPGSEEKTIRINYLER